MKKWSKPGLLEAEYKESLDLLNNRISDLTRQRDFLEARTRDPEKDPAIIELDDRLRPLKAMQADLREVTKEVEHYYEKSWWRSEKYTFNKYIKPRQFVYAGSSGR